MSEIQTYINQTPWLNETIRIIVFFIIAWFVSLLSKRIARRIMGVGRLAPLRLHPKPEREKTLQSLLASTIRLFAFIIAILASLSLFVDPDTLAWVVGLFSAAFGLGARPLISDYLAGLSFIFEDTFSVGEKIELPGIHPMTGLIEAINLRTTWMRSSTGELNVIPNGEIRTIRNFSRGKFSIANIILKIDASDLDRVILLLDELNKSSVSLLPNLLEPWQVISESGIIGQHTELTLVAKARFRMAAEMRPRLLALVQEHLADADIELVD